MSPTPAARSAQDARIDPLRYKLFTGIVTA
jgi:hypothetical protein